LLETQEVEDFLIRDVETASQRRSLQIERVSGGNWWSSSNPHGLKPDYIALLLHLSAMNQTRNTLV
ncbi:hypothetical protein HDU77_001358, partial [Chytriomyces hyalinus]